MTRDMTTILFVIDALLSEGDREVVLRYLREVEEGGGLSQRGVDDVRNALDIFGGTFSIRNDPKDHRPDTSAEGRRLSIKTLISEYRGSQGGEDEAIMPGIRRVSRYERDPVI